MRIADRRTRRLFTSTRSRGIATILAWATLSSACGGTVTIVEIQGNDAGEDAAFPFPANDAGHIPLPPGPDGGMSEDATIPGDAQATSDAEPSLDAQTNHDADAGTSTGCHPDPASFDVPGNGCDDDGDGTVDNAPACDVGLATTGDANAFVKAIGLCQTAAATDTKWGVVSATFTNGHTSVAAPADAQHGILPKFGSTVIPREGTMLGVLSSGGAGEQDSDTGPFFKGAKTGMQGSPILGGTNSGDAPPGFPKSSFGCAATATATTVADVINLKLQIRVPLNAHGFSLDFDFWSGEWPEYVCSQFNDQFVPFLTSKAFNAGVAGNIAYDAKGSAIGTDASFFDRCTPNAVVSCSGLGLDGGTAPCAAGDTELKGTGFDDPGMYCGTQTSSGGGATGWLTSSAPVEPGEVITLELMIWDTGDPSYDSSVLLDHFTWLTAAPTTSTARAVP